MTLIVPRQVNSYTCLHANPSFPVFAMPINMVSSRGILETWLPFITIRVRRNVEVLEDQDGDAEDETGMQDVPQVHAPTCGH